MRKFLASLAFMVVFAGYALYQYLGSASVTYISTTAPAEQVANNGNSAQTAPSQNPIAQQTQPTPAQTIAPTPASAPVAQSQGEYADGTYTGSTENAYYGYVQVQATVSGGKLTDVEFLQYPNDRSTSRFINTQAMPVLKSEAIQAQSAQVDGVSGASDTSAAFQQSLASALAQAKS